MSDAMAQLSPYFDLYEFTTGRRLLSVGEVRTRAEARGDDAIVQECDEALAIDDGNLDIEALWRKSRNIDPNVRGLHEPDRALDRSITGLFRHLEATIHSFGPDHPRSKKARELLDEFFPDGAGGITGLEYEDEVTVAQRMVQRLRSNWGGHLDELGLRPAVDLIDERASQMHTALLEEQSRDIDFGQVRAARKRGQEAMLGVVAKILGTYNKPTDEHARARNELLGPIMRQNELIGEMYRKRQPITDVDPQTGEDIVEPNDTDEPVTDDPTVDADS